MRVEEERTILREATLEVLVACRMIPRHLPAIRRLARREVPFTFTDDDLLFAIKILIGMGFLTLAENRFGISDRWEATPEGVLYVERGSPSPQSRE